ncbi:unnamed protein product [Protopolystoma xenopodis]|uniref:Uncharacterized protein n=1 Tax=Protopolystoma xenopodis TaxID=117903 RepID=A0A448WDA0_9PLAT|nr:unnamed protein product [Protopolystoma xenopodis]
MMLRMAILTDDADYDAGETFGNVTHPRFNFGNAHAGNGLRNRCVPLSLPTNMTKLRKQGLNPCGSQTANSAGQTISILQSDYMGVQVIPPSMDIPRIVPTFADTGRRKDLPTCSIILLLGESCYHC